MRENESVRSMDFVYKPERYGEAEEYNVGWEEALWDLQNCHTRLSRQNIMFT